MKKFILIVLSAILLLSLFSCGELSPEECAEKLLSARTEGDIETCTSLTVNPYMSKKSNSESRAHKLWASYYGNDVELTEFKILKTREYSDRELKTLSDYLVKTKNYPENSLEDAKKLNIKFTLKGEKKEGTLHRSVVMTKIDGTWYWGFDGENSPYTVLDILKGKDVE